MAGSESLSPVYTLGLGITQGREYHRKGSPRAITEAAHTEIGIR